MPKRKWLRGLLWAAVLGLLIGLIWWWQWRAPYRTLMAFLNALEKGDIETLYNLTPPKERRLKIITPELIQQTYHYLLKPLLLNHYKLVGIKRLSYNGAVKFILYYRDEKGNEINPPLIVFVSRPPNERQWYIPFSYFVFTTAHSLIGFDETEGDAWMYRTGYRFVYLHNGGIIPLKTPPNLSMK